MNGCTRRRVLIAGLAAAGAPLRANETGYEWRPWPRNRRARALELDRLDGAGRWNVAEQAGRVVLANFWASWCGPCRAEMPSLARLAAQHAADQLAVVAVNYKEPVEAIRRYVDTLGLDLPVLLDRDGAAAAAWTVRILPSTLVFDRSGSPVGVLVGEIDWLGSAAQALLEPWLAKPALRKARL